jgi:hypothetical protein
MERISRDTSNHFSKDVIIGLGLLRGKITTAQRRRPSSLVLAACIEPNVIDIEETRHRKSTNEQQIELRQTLVSNNKE